MAAQAEHAVLHFSQASIHAMQAACISAIVPVSHAAAHFAQAVMHSLQAAAQAMCSGLDLFGHISHCFIQSMHICSHSRHIAAQLDADFVDNDFLPLRSSHIDEHAATA